MKTKTVIDSKLPASDKNAILNSKPKSLRPMRSMVAVRSLKSRTGVAQLATKAPEQQESAR